MFSLFLSEVMVDILNGVKQWVNLSDIVEIIMEVNLGIVEVGKFVGFYQVGVN